MERDKQLNQSKQNQVAYLSSLSSSTLYYFLLLIKSKELAHFGKLLNDQPYHCLSCVLLVIQ